MKIRSKLLKASLAAILVGGGVLLTWPVFQADANPLQELKERETRVRKVAADALETVVALTSRDGSGAGSGVIVSKDGLIMTASHVIDALGDEFTVTLFDGREVKARPLGSDRNFDAALARITSGGTFPFRPLAKDVEVGEWCVAMGHPGGPEADRTPPVRLGKIWNQGQQSKFLTSDCILSGGDSGGPLFNLDGEVIGIHSSISPNANYNRHVPVTVFHEDWDRMVKGEFWGRLETAALLDDELPRMIPGKGALLGVQLMGAEPVVASVIPLSAADAAGIRAGDEIVAFEGAPVKTTTALQRLVASRKPGDKVTVKIRRDGAEKTLDVTLTGQI